MADGAFAAMASPLHGSADRPSGRRARRAPRSANGSTGAPISDIDSARFRSILSRFATGVVAITAIDQDSGLPTGLAANSFTSVSLDPPLVAFCVAHTSTTWPRLRGADRHCVNILSEPQLDVCKQLAAKGCDKFADLEWTASPSGSPVLKETLAWLECSIEHEYVAGDHVIVVAQVHHLDKHHDGEPLLFYQGGYGRFDGDGR
jgi:flavin reductase (DIM6/NTAB) family NADH-FMN oxidoreductase RutF